MNVKVFVYDKKTNQTVLKLKDVKSIEVGGEYLIITDAQDYTVRVNPKHCKTRIYQN